MANVRVHSDSKREFLRLYDSWARALPSVPGQIGKMWVVPSEGPGDGRMITFHQVPSEFQDVLREQHFHFEEF
jgi:hypothetical protein